MSVHSRTLREIARALGGEVSGNQVLAPGPGHGPADRSMAVRPSSSHPDGFVVHSYSGDDWRACRDHVALRLGLADGRQRAPRPIAPTEARRRQEARERAEADAQAETEDRQKRAFKIWDEARDPRGTVVEVHLGGRCLDLSDEIAGTVLRFHPRCPWGRKTTAPAIVALMRDAKTGDPVAIHRTFLSPRGEKIGRAMLGPAGGAAVMLDPSEAVTLGLAIGEGLETCLSARQLGLRPVWCVGSAGGVGGFPVLNGIEALTILGEQGCKANERECAKVRQRWNAAGIQVDTLISTQHGVKDVNDFHKMICGVTP